MSGTMIALSFGITFLLSVFLAVGITSLIYWVNDRAISPFIVSHRRGLVRAISLSFLAVLYVIQGLQFQVDPVMSVFGYHWAFLNLMLVCLYVIVVQVGDLVTLAVQAVAAGMYVWRFAAPLSGWVVGAYLVWLALLMGCYWQRRRLHESRLLDHLAILAVGVWGIGTIYLTQPRSWDGWWWGRELLAYALLSVIICEANRLMLATDVKTADLQRVAAYERLTGDAAFTRDQAELARLLVRAQDLGLSLTVVALDVDRFGDYSRSVGFLSGNVALVKFADVLHDVVATTPNGRFFRSGGDEFTLALLDATPQATVALVGRHRGGRRSGR
ncbi:GGDEF domain-containing protein [Lacticaseibacillus parakribbianus]|uniref:GGDEF domain-containing protein n=1 Tax=Lacticaseibacillus parakribbianus TaxID=2970927 RepID=UPI0021CB8DDB